MNDFYTHIFLHNESKWTKINIDEILLSLKKIFSRISFEKLKFKDDFFLIPLRILTQDEINKIENQSIIQDVKNELNIYNILNVDNNNLETSNHTKDPGIGQPNSIEIDKENFQNDSKEPMMYDGFILQKIYQEILKNKSLELDLSNLFIIITDKLICTFEETDWRYHARYIILGNPTIISTSGILEGPAKPKDYYLKLVHFPPDPEISKKLDEQYKGRFIAYNDWMINEIIESLVIQSLYFFKEGEAFCEDTNCRLFNSHWQEDLMRLSKSKTLCKKHTYMLRNYYI